VYDMKVEPKLSFKKNKLEFNINLRESRAKPLNLNSTFLKEYPSLTFRDRDNNSLDTFRKGDTGFSEFTGKRTHRERTQHVAHNIFNRSTLRSMKIYENLSTVDGSMVCNQLHSGLVVRKGSVEKNMGCGLGKYRNKKINRDHALLGNCMTQTQPLRANGKNRKPIL
jgi:hypothetical protein